MDEVNKEQVTKLKSFKEISLIEEQPLTLTSKNTPNKLINMDEVNKEQGTKLESFEKIYMIEGQPFIMTNNSLDDFSELIRQPAILTMSGYPKTCECCCKLCNCCKIPANSRVAHNNSLRDKIIYWLDEAFIRYDIDTCEIKNSLCLFSCKCKFCF
jgi:hypothetical protein